MRSAAWSKLRRASWARPSACSTMPERDPAIEDARLAVSAAQRDPQVAALAALELNQAVEAFQHAEAVWLDRGETRAVRHLAYLARQRAAIAVETARLRAAEAAVASADAERQRIRLVARTREAEQAQRSALLAQAEAEAQRRQAAMAEQQAIAAQQQAQRLQELAAASQEQAREAEARARLLEAQLVDLQARRTDRGMVVTLGDVLFDSGRAQLKPGGVRTVEKLAEFMRQYPQRRVAIEGFTDSLGTESLNQELSERRANSVRLVLIDMGIDPARITVHGYGKSYPIASNGNVAGRQLNRRVEIVISDDDGVIRPRVS